jgi:eukaryotic-like serine/threonine-protein kinase
MPVEPRVLDLLLEYEERREKGEPVSPEQLCADCPELLPEVRKRLDALRRIDRQLDTTPIPAAPPPAEHPSLPGYEVLGELGHGGMGVVYLARELALDRLVAVKMLQPHGRLTGRELARFRSEAEALARLVHPHIVQVYAAGEVEGRPYLVLEYVPGGSLDRHVGDRAQPARQSAELVRALAGAIHFAHQHHVVHRDLKPGNVLLLKDGTPKVSDFGLAKRMDRSYSPTLSREVLGTPSYMAPEQVFADRPVGPAADVYGLGGILYKMLTGRPPFAGETLEDILLQVVGSDPVPPTRLQPKVPRDLEAICLKCLEKEPARRYPDANALADDLGRFLAGEQVRARPLTWWRRGVKWARRRPAVAALWAVLLLGGLGLAVGGALWYEERTRARAFERLSGRQREALERGRREQDELEATLDSARRERDSLQGDLRSARETLYAADMVRARAAWESGRVGALERFLLRHSPARDADPDPRGFEWYYLAALTRRPGVRTWHPEARPLPIYSLAVSPDGRALATLDAGGAVTLWDPHTGRVRRVLRDPTPAGRPGTSRPLLSYSPEGRWLAVLKVDGTVTLWDARRPAKPRRLDAGTDPVTAFAFAPDGKSLAGGGPDGGVRFWDPATGKRAGKALRGAGTLGGNDRVISLAFSPDGRTLVAGHPTSALTAWALPSGEARTTLQGDRSPVGALAFSPRGDVVALALHSPQGLVQLWDPATLRGVGYLSGHTERVTSVAFDREGRTVVTGSADGTARLWDSSTGRQLATLGEHRRGVSGVAFLPAGKVVVTASGAGEVRRWEPEKLRDHDLLGDGALQVVRALAFTPDGSRLLTAGPGEFPPDQPELTVWDPARGRRLRTIQGRKTSIVDVSFSPDGKTLATAHTAYLAHGLPGEVRLWDAATGAARATLRGHRHAVFAVAFSPDGGHLASAGGDPSASSATGQVLLWDSSGRLVRAFPEQEGAVVAAAFSPDGKRLATAAATLSRRGARVQVWDVPSGRARAGWEEESGQVFRLAFTHGGKALLGVTGDLTRQKAPGSLRVWDAKGKLLDTLPAHGALAAALGVSADGKQVATGGFDGKVKLWDLSARTSRTLGALKHPVYSLAFSPDGTALACGAGPVEGGKGAEVRVWATGSGKETARFPCVGNPVVAFARGGVLAAGTLEGDLRLLDPAGKRPARTLLEGPDEGQRGGHTRALTALGVSSDGKRMATGGLDRVVKLWDLSTYTVLRSLGPQPAAVSALAFSPDGKSLATGTGGLELSGAPGEVRLWDVVTGKGRAPLLRNRSGFTALAFLPDGKTLAVGTNADLAGSRPGEVLLLDVGSGRVKRRLGEGLVDVKSFAVAPGGSLLAAGDGLGTLLIWDLEAGGVRPCRGGHTGSIEGLAFSPDGRTLASGAGDQEVRLWAVRTGNELCTLRHGEPVTALAFAPGGELLATAGRDQFGGRVRLWRAPRGAGRLPPPAADR